MVSVQRKQLFEQNYGKGTELSMWSWYKMLIKNYEGMLRMSEESNC